MYQPKIVVGNFFEDKVMKLFGLIRMDPYALGTVPDLVSRTGSFYVEVKSASYTNGGVINREQLYRFDAGINARRFYAFAYHPITENMQRDYPTPRKLRNALSLRTLFLFPFSIAKAHFEHSKQKNTPKHDSFVQMRESTAIDIFSREQKVWKRLCLDINEYAMSQPAEKVRIITRQGNLEQEILDSFEPKFL